MLKILVFVIFSVIGTGEGSPRIINGVDYDIGEAPYQVLILRNNRIHCGGAIYDNDIIITAAHCLIGISKSSLTIRAGSKYPYQGGQLRTIANSKAHKFNRGTGVNDIGVIHLKNPLQFNKKIQNIQLARNNPKPGSEALVTGWGATSSTLPIPPSQLQGVHVTIIAQKECLRPYTNYTSLTRDGICARGKNRKGSCGGDSGGPLVYNNELVGIVSYGGKLCGSSLTPGVYANVAVHHKWILNSIDELRN